MKNLWLTLRILIAIWPEVMQLIRHIKAMIAEADHRIPAAKHAIQQAKRTIPDAAISVPRNHIKVQTYTANRFPAQLDELESM